VTRFDLFIAGNIHDSKVYTIDEKETVDGGGFGRKVTRSKNPTSYIVILQSLASPPPVGSPLLFKTPVDLSLVLYLFDVGGSRPRISQLSSPELTVAIARLRRMGVRQGSLFL
jgi:hypothetical protein